MNSFEFGRTFKDQKFKERVKPHCTDKGNTVEISFRYPQFDVFCVDTKLFALDAAGKVIEKFNPEEKKVDDSNILTKLAYSLTLSELNDYGCELTQKKGTGDIDIDEYKCPLKQFFYMDYGHSFPNK